MPALGALGEGLVELGLEPGDDRTVVLGFGGDAPNATVMASRLGAQARVAGRVGDDALGRRLLGFWRASGVDVSHVVVDAAGATGIYVNERGAEGLHRFDYHRTASAGSRLAPGDVPDSFFEGLGALHVTGVTLAVSDTSQAAALDAIERARSRDVLVSLAVNHRPALGGDVTALRAAARSADAVFASEDEIAAVFEVDGDELARALPRTRELVVSRGARGATLVSDGHRVDLAAPAVAIVDATGAGDALAGAYLAVRLGGGDPETALATGIAAASLSCRARGCALSYPDAAEVAAAASGRST